jgi:hypothetical protein
MATFQLANWHNFFQASLNGLVRTARPDVQKANIWSDFEKDSIQLGVTYHLFSRDDLMSLRPREVQELFARRIHEILGTKKKTPKQISVERRRMLWRGECARKAKVRKK